MRPLSRGRSNFGSGVQLVLQGSDFDRLRSVTVSAQLSQDVTIGDAVAVLGGEVRKILPPGYAFAWDGEARDFVESARDTYLLFGLALLFTFLVLAA